MLEDASEWKVAGGQRGRVRDQTRRALRENRRERENGRERERGGSTGARAHRQRVHSLPPARPSQTRNQASCRDRGLQNLQSSVGSGGQRQSGGVL